MAGRNGSWDPEDRYYRDDNGFADGVDNNARRRRSASLGEDAAGRYEPRRKTAGRGPVHYEDEGFSDEDYGYEDIDRAGAYTYDTFDRGVSAPSASAGAGPRTWSTNRQVYEEADPYYRQTASPRADSYAQSQAGRSQRSAQPSSAHAQRSAQPSGTRGQQHYAQPSGTRGQQHYAQSSAARGQRSAQPEGTRGQRYAQARTERGGGPSVPPLAGQSSRQSAGQSVSQDPRYTQQRRQQIPQAPRQSQQRRERAPQEPRRQAAEKRRQDFRGSDAWDGRKQGSAAARPSAGRDYAYEDAREEARRRRSVQHIDESELTRSQKKRLKQWEKEQARRGYDDGGYGGSSGRGGSGHGGGGRGGNGGGYDGFDGYSDGRGGKVKRKRHPLRVLLIVLIVIAALGAVLYVGARIWFHQGYEGEVDVITNDIEGEHDVWDDYISILIVGSDGNEEGGGGYNGGDVDILCSINRNTGEVRLLSFYRDLYMVNEEGETNKLTNIFRRGNAVSSINALNINYDLHINEYVTVGWDSVAEAIDMLGGVEVNVPEEMLEMMNVYIEHTATVTGMENIPVTHSGPQVLTGVQAVAYCRIRYITVEGYSYGDFGRSERQREVLSALFQKAKSSPMKMVDIVRTMWPKVETSLTMEECLSLMPMLTGMNLADTAGFPRSDENGDHRRGGYAGTASVVYSSDTLSDISWIYEYLFGITDYVPSARAQQCAAQVAAEITE